MPNTYVRRMHSCQVHVRRVSGRPSPPSSAVDSLLPSGRNAKHLGWLERFEG